jgi:hypothetical protein
MNAVDSTRSKNETFHAGAAFRVQGLDLDMGGIARELGNSPTYTHRRGEPSRINKNESNPQDMWLMGSPLGVNLDLELHLNWLAEQLLPQKDYILSLMEKNTVDIYCYKTCYTEQADLTVSPEVLMMFVELSLKMSVSLIYLPDEPES